MSSEAELIAFAEVVRKFSHRIAVKCLAGKTDEAGELAVELGQLAGHVKTDKQMAQERRGEYDLTLLQVDATMPTNSETLHEREHG